MRPADATWRLRGLSVSVQSVAEASLTVYYGCIETIVKVTQGPLSLRGHGRACTCTVQDVLHLVQRKMANTGQWYRQVANSRITAVVRAQPCPFLGPTQVPVDSAWGQIDPDQFKVGEAEDAATGRL